MLNSISKQFLISNLDLVPLEGTNFSYELKTMQDTYDRCAYSLVLVEHQGSMKDRIETYMIVFNHNNIEADGDRAVMDNKELLKKARKEGCLKKMDNLQEYWDTIHKLDDTEQKSVLAELEREYTELAYKEMTEQKGPFRDLAETVFLSVMKKDCDRSTNDSVIFNCLEQSYYRRTDERKFTPGIGGHIALPEPRQSTKLCDAIFKIETSDFIYEDDTQEPRFSMEIVPGYCDYDTLINDIPEEVITILNTIPRIPKQIRKDFTNIYNASRKELELRERIAQFL